MAMKSCKECGNQVSTKAPTCPTCGAPVKKKSSLGGWIGILLILFLLIPFLSSNNSSTNTSSASTSKTPSSSKTKTDSPPTRQTKQQFFDAFSKEITSIKKHSVAKKIDNSVIKLEVLLFSAWADMLKKADTYTLDEKDKATMAEFRKVLSRKQKEIFPKMRDAYGPIIRETLWEHDITAKTVGAGFNKVEFTGGAFAANRNIKDFQKNIRMPMEMLRFKETRYRWYEDADKYTYYTLETLNDADIAVWNDVGFYEKVD